MTDLPNLSSLGFDGAMLKLDNLNWMPTVGRGWCWWCVIPFLTWMSLYEIIGVCVCVQNAATYQPVG